MGRALYVHEHARALLNLSEVGHVSGYRFVVCQGRGVGVGGDRSEWSARTYVLVCERTHGLRVVVVTFIWSKAAEQLVVVVVHCWYRKGECSPKRPNPPIQNNQETHKHNLEKPAQL